MLKYIAFLFILCTTQSVHLERPTYEYQYQAKDVMHTDASSLPVHGYHVVQSGYYPHRDFDEYSEHFYPEYRRLGHPYGIHRPHTDQDHRHFRGNYNGNSFFNLHPSQHRIGSKYIDRNLYSEEGKKLKDDSFEKVHGYNGENINAEQEGYNNGNLKVKDNKGASGYYNEEEGKKKATGDGKTYHGRSHSNEEGKQGGEQNDKSSHKKGHVVKGFKKSHHKDEDSKTEEFYDEAHDEGGHNHFGGQSGNFGKNTASSYNGGHDNGDYAAIEKKKGAHYDSNHHIGNSNGDRGHYNKNKHYENGQGYDLRNGIDQHSLLGHQEVSKVYNQHPYHVSFFPVD